MKATITDWRNPDYDPIYKERIARLKAVRRGGQPAIDALKVYYRENPVDWIEDWATTYDPRAILDKRSPFIPFILFPRQKELIRFWYEQMHDRADCTVEKSRDTGISWCIAAFAVWAWCNIPGSATGIGSYEQSKVDELGVIDSSLEKCRTIIRQLPKELKPHGLKEGPRGDLMHGRLVNPENGSTIVGEVGDNIGRGARATIYFVDEAAHLTRAEKVDASLASTADFKVYASTAYGQGQFYKKIQSGAFANFRFHWTDDPRKDQDWYNSYLRKWGAVITAQEVDIDHEASVEDICIPAAWITSCRALARHLDDLGALEPHAYPGVGGLDVGGGKAKSVFIARFGPIMREPVSWGDPDTTDSAYRAIRESQLAHVPVLNFDSVGIGAGVASTLRKTTATVRVISVKAREPEPDKDPQNVDDWIAAAAREQNPEPEQPAKPDKSMRTLLCRAINVGVPASKVRVWDDGQTSNEKFVNLKAELWWDMRSRAQKSHEYWLAINKQRGGMRHPIEELLLLPDHDQLCRELSWPKVKYMTGGKIAMESKDELKRRGVASPDFAEAASLSLVPGEPVAEWHRIEGLS